MLYLSLRYFVNVCVIFEIFWLLCNISEPLFILTGDSQL